MGFGWFSFSLFPHVVLLGAGALLLALAPSRMRGLQLEVLDAPVASGVMGLGAFVATVGAIVVTALSLVGIPVAVALAFALPAVGLVGLAAVASILGHALPLDWIPRTSVARLAAGVAVLFVATLVPVVGQLLWTCAACVGLGALVRTRFRPVDGGRPAVPGGPYRTVAG